MTEFELLVKKMRTAQVEYFKLRRNVKDNPDIAIWNQVNDALRILKDLELKVDNMIKDIESGVIKMF